MTSTLDIIILATVASLNGFLCVAVLLGGRGRVNIIFSNFILFIVFWSITNYLAEIVNELNLARLLVGLTYAFAIIIVTLFMRFVSIFPDRKSNTLLIFEKIFYPTSVIFIILSFTPLITSNVFIGDPRNYITAGPAISIYIAYFILLVTVAFFILFKKYRILSGVERSQIIYVIYGTVFTVVSASITNLFVPFLTSDWSVSRYGPYFSIFLVAFSAYAILKRHLFSVKVIAAELLTFVIWTFILIRVILADTFIEQLESSILLVLVIVFGILLIRSVLQEVNQREKIEALAADLEKANVRLTELDRQKSEFVSFATHQLRAPLTAMKGYASLLLEGDMGPIGKDARNGVERIYDSTNTLTNIVNDYLNISRIELGTMKYAFDTLDLKTLIEDVIAELKPNIDKSGLKFSFEAENIGTDYRITADKDKLKQVIANVIDNSVKYTPSGSVAVTLGFDRIRHLFVVKIKDTGVGIASETLPRLFQKFSRADNASKTNIRGTGLGLYVAKQMIEAHHGTIRAESPGEGRGSTFIIELEPLMRV